MRFNSYVGVAIHTLLIIHERAKIQKVTSSVISEIVGITPDRIRKLLTVLKNAGFIHVAPRKGKAGTTMAMPLDQITIYDIFKVLEPDFLQRISAPNTRHNKMSYTGLYANEVISGYFEALARAIQAEWENITLADTLAEIVKKENESPHKNPRDRFKEPI